MGDIASIRMARNQAWQLGALRDDPGGQVLVSEDMAEQLTAAEWDELTSRGATVLVDSELEADSLESAAGVAGGDVEGVRVLPRPEGGDG